MTEALKREKENIQENKPKLSLYVSADKGLSLDERLVRRQIHYHEMRLEELRRKLDKLQK